MKRLMVEREIPGASDLTEADDVRPSSADSPPTRCRSSPRSSARIPPPHHRVRTMVEI